MKNLPILILHGWNLFSDKYVLLKNHLIKHSYKVISFDLPGFGKNNKLNYPLTIQDYSQYITEELKNRNVKKVIIVGHSFGGRIGIYLGVHNPSLVNSLIISGTPALGADLTLKEKIYLILAKIGKLIFALPILCLLQDYARKLLYKVVGSTDYYSASGILRKTFQNIVEFRLESLLNKINIPTLIIWGKEDRIVPVKVAYGLHKLIKNSKLVFIDNARHGLPWTHPKIFADEVEKFVEELK